MNILQLLGFALAGLVLASILSLENIQDSSWYQPLITILLAIGLYASTFGIDLKEAKQHIRLIVSAVTVGVVLKALIIGVTLSLIFRDPFFLILGIIVAQIDPLSVSSLMRGKRMSEKAKTILASWASFDDPMTVILALYAPALISQLTNLELGSAANSADNASGLMTYVSKIGVNLAIAFGVFCLFTVVRFYKKQIIALLPSGETLARYVILALSFVVSVLQFSMLSIALIGLFLRPPIDKYIDTIIKGALILAVTLLGVLLIDGVNIIGGVALGIAAYFSQVIVGFILTKRLPRKDRWHIAFAQQNGITAIILALIFEPIHPGTIAVVAPAILVTNSLHFGVNKIIDTYVFKQK